jgi:hypothetical protein
MDDLAGRTEKSIVSGEIIHSVWFLVSSLWNFPDTRH